jgi:Ser/Thr protein kinase RdoA (MazF antagonist)
VDDAGGGSRGLRPELTPAIVDAVRQAWGFDLGGPAVLGGSTGLNLRAASDGMQVVVRVHRPHVTASRVEALQLAREAAAAGGVPTAPTILGRDGERNVIVESCVIEVEAFIESDAKMDSLRRIRHAMRMLGRLHDALETAELPEAADDVQFANYVAAAEVATKTADGVRRIRTLDAALHPIADTAEALAVALIRTQHSVGPLPSQWCHGDFWDNNVLFRNDEIALVADFGFMNQRLRVDDVALTLYFTLRKLDAANDKDPSATLAALAHAYDSGTRRPLSDAERAALPLALARQPLWSIAVWAAQLDDPEEVAAHLQGHDAALRRAQNIVDRIDHWREAFAAGRATHPVA